MRKEPKSLAEWLESEGNPKHSIAEGKNGSMIIVVDDSSSLENGITIYSFKEYDFGDCKSFWMSSGWGLRKEYLPALKKILNDETTEVSKDKYIAREKILRDRLEMARHNLCCYSANYGCTIPKEGHEKEWKEAAAEIEILEAWLKEFRLENKEQRVTA